MCHDAFLLDVKSGYVSYVTLTFTVTRCFHPQSCSLTNVSGVEMVVCEGLRRSVISTVV